MHIELINDPANIPFTPSEWNNLVAYNETNTIFQTFEWFDSWWRIFGTEHELFFLTVHNNSQIIGFAPLMIANCHKGEKKLAFVGDTNSDYLDFILPTEKKTALNAICDFLYENSNFWDTISLLNVPEHSSTHAILKMGCKQANLYYLINDTIACPALVIKGQERNTQHIIDKYRTRRPFNYFSRQGELRFHNITEKDELTTYLPLFFDQHIERWGITDTVSLFTNKQNQEFYRRLACKLLQTGKLLFTVVELDGIPLSFHYGFDYDSKILWYKPSFNIKYANHSPGVLLIHYLLQYALNNGKTEIDFTIGNEPFKARFTNLTRINTNIMIFKTSSTFWFKKTLRRLRTTTKKLLGRN